MLEGLHPNRPTHVMRLATDEASARQATELLGEVFDPGETAVAAFEADGGAWALEAYFASAPRPSAPPSRAWSRRTGSRPRSTG